MLTSSLALNGGLNCTLPGNVTFHANGIGKSSHKWNHNAVGMFSRPHVQAAMDEDLKSMRENNDFVTNIKNKEGRLAELNAKIADSKRERDQALAKRSGLKAEIEDLTKEYEDLQSELLRKLENQGTSSSSTTSQLVTRFRKTAVPLLHKIKADRTGQEKAVADILAGKTELSSDSSDPEEAEGYTRSVSAIQQSTDESFAAWKAKQESFRRTLQRQKIKGEKVVKDFWEGFHRL